MASSIAVDGTIQPRHSALSEKVEPRTTAYTASRTLLTTALLAAPLAFGAVQPWAWGALAVITFILFFLWSIALVRQGRLAIFWSPLYLPAGLFFLLGTFQLAAHRTMDPLATREALLKLAADLMLFFLAGQLWGASGQNVVPSPRFPAHQPPDPISGNPFASEISNAPLRWTIVIYAFLLALFAILQSFSSLGLIYWSVQNAGWAFGPYVNHNHYAGLMEMLIPLSVASALPALRKNLSAAVLGTLVSIPIASLLLSGSRGGFVSLVVEALLGAVLVFSFGPRRARPVTALLGGATILTAGLLFFWMAPREIANRLVTVGDSTHPRDVELGNRLAVAQGALDMLRDHPWLGTGLGSFETVYPRYESFPSDFRWDHAHNDYAEALAETGLAGGLAIFGGLGGFCWLAFHNLRERLRHRTGWLPFAAALGCCGLLVHSFADFNLHIPANAAWFGVCAALATTAPKVAGS